MKTILFTVSISLLLWPIVTLGESWFPEQHLQIDFEALTLQPPFTEREESQEDIRKLASKFGQLYQAPHDLYDEAFISELITFIRQHPSEGTALSAKYYLAEYLRLSWEGFEGRFERAFLESEDDEFDFQAVKDLLNLIKEDMLRMYQEIATESPETWQGRLAAHFTPEYFEAKFWNNAAYRKKRRALWPLLLEIQHERDFYFLKLYQGEVEPPMELKISAERIRFALEEDNVAEAEAELARMKAEYPDSVKVTRAEKDIQKVYEDQFHGRLYSLPEGEILHILMSSEDSLEIKQAAAALGNLEIWGSFRNKTTYADTLNEVVLGYIDRAMSDDTAEREEMVELIYRLWHLAVPALLETLDADAPEWVAFAGDRLIYMKNEEIITAIIEKARTTEDEDKKAQLIEILSRMNEPCEPVMRFRECLDDAQAEELYQRLVVPALEELQTEEPTPAP